ncbi:MAG: response regulator [Roseovarius sp.]|jgi:PAS domain S-box-containing protein|nr:response regulator [Roseovarius sp.]
MSRPVDSSEGSHATGHKSFQLAFADRIRSLECPDEVVSTASALLGQHLKLARVVYGAADAASDLLTMKPDWTNGELPSLAGVVLRLADFGPLVVDAVRQGSDLVIADVTTDPRSAGHVAAYAANGVRAFVAIPLMKGGRLRAILSLHDSQPRQWTPQEVALAHDMVDRTWAAAESAQADAELRRERDQSQHIFDSMTEGFAVLDRHWTVSRVNAEGLRMTQRAAHEVIGQEHWTLWPAMKGTELDRFFEQLRQAPQKRVTEVPFSFAGGAQGWMEVRAYPLLDSGMALFFRDITERKASQAQLEDADRRKDEFLAMLAHELRNPLAPITAAAELLRTARLGEEQISKTSEIIERQVHHMTRLVDDLLDVSRVTLGLIELDRHPLDIYQLVSSAIEQVSPLIRARQHQLSVQMAADRTWVQGDRQRLVQVLANILNNAAKYTPEGGHLQLSTAIRDGRVLIRVTDNGAGMTPDMLMRAFDLFSQAGRTSDRSMGGLGLGLALVRSLVELHQGQVWCDSPGLGRGSTFTVSLPRLLAETLPAEAQEKPQAGPAPRAPLRILIVDDNADAASMLAMLLELSGHRVWVEHGWRGAMERAQREAPQVCLLDIGLPEVDGNELVQKLRALPGMAQALYVAVTGYGQANDRRQTLAAGFHHHLVKPVDTELLTALLDAFDR